MMKKSKINNGLVIFILVLIGIYILKIREDKIDKKIMLDHYETVGKVINYAKNRSKKSITFIFFMNGKQYDSWTKCKEHETYYLHKYYKLYVAKDNPKQNILFLEEEIKDPNKIKKAGF